jgi:hypothetical protein
MRLNQFSAILGVTSAAIASTILVSPAAHSATFQVFSGVTSVSLDLPTLQTAGLSLTGSSDTVPPVSGNFLVGFPITPATDFIFDFGSGGFAPVSGAIAHTGSITFNNMLTVGNFLIGFDPTRAIGDASGFFVRDTITTGAILFDVATPGTLTFTNETNLKIVADLLVSPELAGVLNDTSLAGATVGAASVDAIAAVPEPATILGALTAGAFLAASRRQASRS